MALIPSGMGWSAEENYMKQYAGTIGNVNKVGGLYDAPVISSDGDITHGLMYAETADRYYYCAVSNSRMQVALRKANTASTAVQIWGLSFDSSDLLYSGYVVKATGVATGWHSAANNTPSGTGWAPGIKAAYGSPSSLSIASITYNAIPIMLHNEIRDAAYKISSDIDKLNDGYSVVAWVKYKTGSTSVSETPVLISSVDSYTFFSGFHNETFMALYNGKRFYFSFAYGIGGGAPFGIQILDYTGSEYPAMSPALLFEYVARSVSLTVTESSDPYADFPYTGEDAGIPNPNPQDDDIDVDSLPSTSFSSAGFCRIYNPDLSDLQDLADYMWTDQNFLTTVINHLKQLIENPMDAVISLSLIPVVPDRESTKSAVNVMFINTGVSMRRVTNQFKSIDCGTVLVEEKYGSVLDYNPYTKVQLYLPFIGTVPLNTDEVMNKTLSVVYHVDVVTGVCCAEVSADSKLLYQFSGHCSVNQPLNSADFGSYLNAAMAAAKLAVGAATGGAGAAAAAGSALDQISPPSTTSPTRMSSDPLLPSGTSLVPAGYYGNGSGVKAPQLEKGNPSSDSGSTNIWEILKHPGTINNAAAVLGGKLDVQHSGGFSGNSGFLAKRRPYLIINRPQLANPEQYGQFNGYPSMIYANLGTCTGYTQVQSVFLSGFDAMPSELSEISSVLKAGVVF